MSAEIIENEMITAKPNSEIASQPCPSGHITADKRLRYAFPKLPKATSFICKRYRKYNLLKVWRSK